MNRQELPQVTVIMAIRNEEDFIERSLGAILAQDYPPEKLEILLADGMSDDDTLKIIDSMPGTERVQLVPNPRIIQSYGLNQLIEMATGEYIVRVDGHTIIAADYVSQCVQTLQATGATNVGGGMDPVGLTPVGDAIAIAGKSRFAVPTVFHVSKKAQYTDTVYLGAWSHRVFEEVGLFNTELPANEDYELNYRIRSMGGKVFFNPEIKSVYYGRQTWSQLARQYYRYGRSKMKMLRKYPRSLRIRQIVAPLFVAGLVSGLISSLLIHQLIWIYVFILCIYLFLGLFFALQATSKVDKSIVTWRVMLAFMIMHVAWGLGFWRELIKPDHF